MKKKIKVVTVAGARPNFIKIAPLSFEFAKRAKQFEHIIVHTGQHYDDSMSQDFFEAFNLPKPHLNLGVGSGSHAIQTAKIMTRFETVCIDKQPDWVIVVGDVNSTMACSLVASKMGIKVAHIEAGLRSFDRTMPEEINRIVTDAIADLLFTPSWDADENLYREGIGKEKIKRVGNIMIDTLVMNLDKALSRKTHVQMGLPEKEFVYVTLHRPGNVDHKEILQRIVNELRHLADQLQIVFSLHPRTQKKLSEFKLMAKLNNYPRILLKDALGYHDSICLTKNAKFVLTDSGGLQEETTYLRVPCLTLRPSTERPITIKEGTNKLTNLDQFRQDAADILNGNIKNGKVPVLWDGKTTARIADIFSHIFSL